MPAEVTEDTEVMWAKAKEFIVAVTSFFWLVRSHPGYAEPC